MASPLDRRVRRLEGERSQNLAETPVLIWNEENLDVDAAVAARFPDGVPAPVRPVVYVYV
jgi:hypothetical protein